MSYTSMDIGESIVQKAFGIPPLAWMNDNFDITPIEHHFFAEIYEISLSEQELEEHPEARGYLVTYPRDFIRNKVNEVQNSQEYLLCRMAFHTLIQEQPEEDRLYIRRNAIYRMHCALMIRDFGGLYDSLDSDCEGLTKEAAAFISARGG